MAGVSCSCHHCHAVATTQSQAAQTVHTGSANKCANTPWLRCHLHWLPFALTPARNAITLLVSKEWSEHLFSWLVKSECLLIGQNLMQSDYQSASRLIKQECLLIDQAKVPPDCLKYRVPLAWLNCNVSWLVEPECLMIGRARVPPDWSSQVASWLVEL